MAEMPNFGRKFRQKFDRNSFCVQISFLCVCRKVLFRQKDLLSAERVTFGYALLPRPFCKRTSTKSITSMSSAEIHNMHQYLLESEKNIIMSTRHRIFSSSTWTGLVQKGTLSADRRSFGRNALFRLYRYFCRNGIWTDALFRLSAERKNFSFGRPLVNEWIF